MYDFHIHSKYSFDSDAPMEEMIKSAINKNLKSICFTEHVDFESSLEKVDFDFNTKDYFQSINKFKSEYKDDIEVLGGVEIGIQPHLFQKYKDYIKDLPLDFIIMSIHGVNGKDIKIDDFTGGKKPIDALIEYYNDMYDCVKGFEDFDVLGHIDYIDRYFQDKTLIPDFTEYAHLVENILKVLIKKGKGIEINTAGLKHGLDYFHPKIDILKLYKELGGEFISFGSDSHSPSSLGYHYEDSIKVLRELGFENIYIFKNREKMPINIL